MNAAPAEKSEQELATEERKKELGSINTFYYVALGGVLAVFLATYLNLRLQGTRYVETGIVVTMTQFLAVVTLIFTIYVFVAFKRNIAKRLALRFAKTMLMTLGAIMLLTAVLFAVEYAVYDIIQFIANKPILVDTGLHGAVDAPNW